MQPYRPDKHKQSPGPRFIAIISTIILSSSQLSSTDKLQQRPLIIRIISSYLISSPHLISNIPISNRLRRKQFVILKYVYYRSMYKALFYWACCAVHHRFVYISIVYNLISVLCCGWCCCCCCCCCWCRWLDFVCFNNPQMQQRDVLPIQLIYC